MEGEPMIKLLDFAARLAEKHSMSREEAERFLTKMVSVMGEGLRAEKVLKVKGLGTFKVISVNARESVDVNTGERIRIEGREKVSFTPETSMRDLVNKPFAQFETVVLNDGVDFDQEHSEENLSEESIEKLPDESLENLSENLSEDLIEESSVETVSQLVENLSEKLDDGSPENLDENPTKGSTKNSEEESEENVEFTSEEKLSEKTSENPEDKEKKRERKQEKLDETFDEGKYYDDELFDEYGYYIGPEDDGKSWFVRFLKNAKTIKWLVGVMSAIVSIMFLGMCVLFFEIKKRDAGIEKFVTEVNSTKHKGEETLSERIAEVREAGAERFHEYDRKVDSLKQLMMVVDTNYEEAVRAAQIIVEEETKRKEAQLARDEAIRKEQERRRVEKERREDTLRMNNITNKAALAREQLARDEEIRQEKEQLRIEKELREKQEQEKRRMEQERSKNVPRVNAVANKSASSRELEKYNSDPRVSTGAYVITGIERTVTVQKGQTFAGICKAYLGSGMECYVEAVNGGIKSVEPGQELKIPTVKTKKSLLDEERKRKGAQARDEEIRQEKERLRIEKELREKQEQEKRRLEQERSKNVPRVNTVANKSASARELEKYNSDPRVSTGAYVITGIERTVTVQKGQTFAGICKAYLGPGMECYVEVVNGGIKSVEPGQELKIPSVKTKKSLRESKK